MSVKKPSRKIISPLDCSAILPVVLISNFLSSWLTCGFSKSSNAPSKLTCVVSPKVAPLKSTVKLGELVPAKYDFVSSEKREKVGLLWLNKSTVANETLPSVEASLSKKT